VPITLPGYGFPVDLPEIIKGEEAGMKDEKPLPSERAAAKLGAAKRRLEKALHVRALTEARILKWGKRVKVLEKRLATDHYKEMDEKAKEARVADAMKVAMGIKKGMAVGRKVDSTGQTARPILRSSVWRQWLSRTQPW
jgi:hypothetical protein